jgi:hypothetical protein
MNRARWTTWVGCLSLGALLCGCDDSSAPDDGMATTVTAATMPPAGSADAGDDGDDDEGDDGDDGEGSSSSPPDDPMDDGDAPPNTTGADDGAAETGPLDDGGAETGAGDDATTGATAGICDPVPGDDPCDACTKLTCCDQLMACEGDTACSCFIGCVEGGGDPFGCSDQCGASIFGAGATGDLVSCSSGPCGGSCV